MFFCGDCRIRTYGPFRTNGLVDRRFRPLSQVTLKKQLRGKDSNLRPQGYEPCKLPLLYPTIKKELYRCGGRIRTYDLQLMRLASYLCSTPQYKKKKCIQTRPRLSDQSSVEIQNGFTDCTSCQIYYLCSRLGFVVGALSSLRLSVMLTQITIQSSNTVI